MKLRIIMADPAGNRTAIVRTPVPAHQRAQIAAKLLQSKELRAEQAGFETAPLMGGAGRLQMMGGEFCGNAARSYGYLLWSQNQGARSDAAGTILIEISGSMHPLEVFCDPVQGSSYTQMPMPREIEYTEEGYPLVISEGITHMILENMEPDKNLVRRMVAAYGDRWDAFGIMFLTGERLTPVVYVEASGSLVYESSCGSGSLAAAWYMERTSYNSGARADANRLEGRTSSFSFCFREPGGQICVDIFRNEDGSISGRMGGDLFLEPEIEIEI